MIVDMWDVENETKKEVLLERLERWHRKVPVWGAFDDEGYSIAYGSTLVELLEELEDMGFSEYSSLL